MASTYVRPPVPSFKKGDFVVPVIVQFRGGVHGTRSCTPDERTAWYADPRNQGMGDDGDGHVFSGTIYVDLPAGTQMVVMKARVQGQVGWSSVGNLAEVKLVATNEILLVSRRSLQLGQ